MAIKRWVRGEPTSQIEDGCYMASRDIEDGLLAQGVTVTTPLDLVNVVPRIEVVVGSVGFDQRLVIEQMEYNKYRVRLPSSNKEA